MKNWWPHIVTVVSVTWVRNVNLHFKAYLIIYNNEKHQHFGVFRVEYIVEK